MQPKRNTNRDTVGMHMHDALLQRAKDLAEDARNGFSAGGLAPMVLDSYPGAQIGRVTINMPRDDESDIIMMEVRMFYEGEWWTLRGSGNTVAGAMLSTVTNSTPVIDDDYDAHILTLLEDENPASIE